LSQATPDLSFGEDLKAEAQASDAKTSAEPTFSDIGKSLNAQFGNKSADDVGKAIKENTPSAQGVVQGAKDAGKKLNKAADLSNVFDDLLGKVRLSLVLVSCALLASNVDPGICFGSHQTCCRILNDPMPPYYEIKL
jgi:hypothetical protein